MFLSRLFSTARIRTAPRPGAVGIEESQIQRFLDSTFELALSRRPTPAETAELQSALRSGALGLGALLDDLKARKTNREPDYDYRSDPDMAEFLSPLFLERSESLQSSETLSRSTYDRLYREHFESGRELIVGQAEYGPQHKERFRELFNAAVFLLQGRTAPRVLELGTSEFSAFFRDLLPSVELHLSDRPVPPDYIGFTESVARRISGCTAYEAVDLERGADAIRSSNLENGSYDLIVFTEVLEHLDINPVEMLAALLALLRPNGFLYLSTPNFFRRENRIKLARFENPQEVYPAADGNWDRHHHHREYGAKELFHFVRRAGGRTHAFYFSSCWDTDPPPPPHERANMVFVIRRHGTPLVGGNPD